ncbi:hypothetical protein RI129_001573 [Pyrocoelia pectoralis]|uniref:Uncharacterized protein n=1 Tax=Pyrocoelia pectoralis TaxID=417401 RepID=A0AAN7VUP5_9COLE
MSVYIMLVFSFLCVTIVFCEKTPRVNEQNEIENKGTTIEDKIQRNLSNFNYSNISDIPNFSSRKSKGGKKKKKNKQDLMGKILPFLIIPFMLQTLIIPMILTALKFMLIKSAFIGKIAILIGLLNMISRMKNQGGLYTHNINIEHDQLNTHLSQQHYGYNGGSEYGAYIND